MSDAIRILHLEDSLVDAELIARMLRKGEPNCVIEHVETREAFIKSLEEFKPDIILADYELPDFNGMQALAIAKIDYSEIPFIFVTGKLGEDIAVDTLKKGASDYIIKDRMTRLVTSIRQALEKKDLKAQRLASEKELLESQVLQLKKLQHNLESTVKAIASIAEMRDPYTAGHQLRVAKLATAIAEKMMLSNEQVQAINTAAIVHDVGKIMIPAEILSKPGKISDLEYTLIKGHPQAGYDILKDIDFTWPIAQMVLQHHERLDGSGYPQGLIGDAILLEARILSVADVVEAMTSHRPYRAGLGLDAAMNEISTKRGSHFDAKVVDACLAVLREGDFSFES